MSAVQVLEVSQDVLDSARLTPSDLKVEMAVHLCAQGRLSIGKARKLAGLALWEIRQLLASRHTSLFNGGTREVVSW
jgi:predicted HTH domain antitoxin